MAIRITLECGHASMLRVRKTPEGYTHDWEVFVRGVDNADIHQYIDRVVFHLHETFPKPKRVLKEPPFVLKESGYAGFVMPIHVYLRNKDEPKKFIIIYDLQLQPSGPTLNNLIRHNEIINSPSEDFRRKLLKGGAIVVSNVEGSIEKNESKTPTMIGKPKLSGSETKKHKLVESKTSDSFAELFGTPLKPTKVSQENKKSSSQPEKSSISKPLVTTEKTDKVDKTPKVKHGPHKDNKKEKVEEKKDKKLKDPSKDRERSKDKSKRPSSPSSKSHSSPSAKRPSSPLSIKRPPSPLLPPAKRPASPKLSKEKEVKKLAPEKEKEKEKEKNKDAPKSALDSSKSERRKDKKKHKEDRDKERKDKYKDGDRSTVKEPPKPPGEKKGEKAEKFEKPDKEKNQEYKSTKEERKSPKPPRELEKPKEEQPLKVEKVEKVEKPEKPDKPKDGKTEKDKQKYKHKKRDKKDKRDGSREREKKEKRERVKVSTEKQNNVPIAPAANPLSTLMAAMPERDSSDSAPSVDDDSFSESKLMPAIKKETENSPPPMQNIPLDPPKPLTLGITADIKKEKVDRSKRDKSKGSRGEERENRKRKRRSESKGDEERAAKREKERGPSTSPPLEPVSSSQSPVVVDQEALHPIKEKEDRNMMEQVVEKDNEADAEQVAPDSTNSTFVDSDVGEPPVFSEDYVSQLKELQQKIMTLQDNQELQRVVQVIAETGQYEITKKTFDFDLCALDRRTVARLQQFFSAS